MQRVYFEAGISLDGFVAGPDGGPKNPLGNDGMKIHEWLFKQKSFLKLTGSRVAKPGELTIGWSRR